jgi:hypothetical protein
MPATTPKSKSAFTFLNSITHRAQKTPKDKSSIKPSEPEMHPQKTHRTSTTPYDEARWLGFFNMGSQTAPAARTAAFTAAVTSPTPTKVAPATPMAGSVVNPISSPGFDFTFRRAPSVELSDDAQKIMAESRDEAARIRAQLASMPNVPEIDPEEKCETVMGRKIAKPKGKVGRFSDVHMNSFKKMDSIANHASSWRLNANRNQPVTTTLKRSPSKAELDKPTLATALKRSPSKVELDKSAAHTLQRSPSKPILQKVESNPFLTRSPSKLDPTRTPEERPMPSAKRVKHVKEDDAGTTRPKQPESPFVTPRRQIDGLVRSKSSLLRPGFSSAMSPTKAFMARTQSHYDLKATTQIPALVRSNTSNNLRLPQPSTLPRSKSMRDLNAMQTPRANPIAVNYTAPTPTPIKMAVLPHTSPIKAPELLMSSPTSGDTPKRVKSILRTPNRRYTRDPLKIAAGTHLATSPHQSELYPDVPATESVIKRVNFTNSTKDKAERDALAMKSASVEPESVAYPNLATTQDINRRTTMSAMPTYNMPGSFTFRSDQEISFGSPKASTIRQVRTSGVGLPPAFQFTGARPTSSPSKRKIDTVGEEAGESEKENNEREENHRPAKKARIVSGGSKSAHATPLKQGLAKSKLPQFGGIGGKRASGLTAARLSMLAKPKRRG